jgi:hypothetical protein
MKEQTRSVRRTLEPAPQLRIMGEIEVMGTQRPLSDQQVALVAFLQCCGPVGRSSVVQAVWAGERISSQRVANLLAEVRSKLGRDRLPDPVDGRYRLVGIETDLHWFEDSVRRLTEEPQPLGPAGLARLRDTYGLIRGLPMSGREGKHWAWLDERPGLMTYAEATIADGVQQLSALAQGSGDVALATAALEAGLLACPLDESLIGRLVELYIDQRRPGTASRVVEAWERGVRRLECGEPSLGPRQRLVQAAQAVAIGSAVTTRFPK